MPYPQTVFLTAKVAQAIYRIALSTVLTASILTEAYLYTRERVRARRNKSV